MTAIEKLRKALKDNDDCCRLSFPNELLVEFLAEYDQALSADHQAQLRALREIKHYCLTTTDAWPHECLGHIVKLCINAGIKEHYPELEELLKKA